MVRATYAFNANGDPFQLVTTPDGQYYTYWGSRPTPNRAHGFSLRRSSRVGEANLSGKVVEPHGAVFLGGSAHDVRFTPLVGRARIPDDLAPAAVQSSAVASRPEWRPAMLVEPASHGAIRRERHRLVREQLGAAAIQFGPIRPPFRHRATL